MPRPRACRRGRLVTRCDELVGRFDELAELRGLLRGAVAGRGSVAIVGGEAGSGKSALASCLAGEAAAAGAAVTVGRAYDMPFTPMFGLWTDVIADLRALAGGAADAIGAGSSPAWSESGHTGATDRTALVEWIRGAVAAVAADQPLVLVLEDLHWADQDSIQLFRHLTRRIADERVLVVATVDEDQLSRSGPMTRMIRVIEREVEGRHIGLKPIPAEDIRAWVARRYSLPAADTDRLADHVCEMTSGNAFFAVELLRALEGTVLHRTGSGWHLGELGDPGLPRRLRQIVESRFVSLTDLDLDRLAAAALIGPEVDFNLWVHAFAGRLDAGEEAMLRVVESAAAAGIVEPAGDGSSFRFVHALVHKALYERTFPVRRRRMHQLLAEMLASGPNPDFDAIARHLDAADDPAAGTWLVRAGERAESRGALLTAVQRYEAALEPLVRAGASSAEQAEVLLRLGLLRRMDDAAQALDYIERAGRHALAVGDRDLSLRVLAGRGLIRCYAGIVDAGLADLEAGLSALENAARADDVVDDELSPLATRKLVHRGAQVYWLAAAGRLDEAVRLGEEQLRRGSTRVPGGFSASSAAVEWGLGLVDAAAGRVDLARERFASAGRLHQRAGQARLTFISARDELVHVALPYLTDDHAERRRLVDILRRLADKGAAARSFVDAIDNINYPLLHVMALDGRWNDVHRVVSAMEGYGIPLLRHVVGAVLGPIARAQGDVGSAWSLINEAWRDGPTTAPLSVGWYHTLPQQRLAVELALDAGDLDLAAAWLSAHEGFLRQAGIALGAAEARCLRARFELSSGAAARALPHAEAALRIARRPRQPLAQITAHRLLGQLTADADPDGARAHFAAADDLAVACGAAYEQILTMLTAAETLCTVPSAEELDRVQRWCAERGAEPALTRLRRLRDPSVQRKRSYPAGLTPREAEVLSLLATGLSDREIAAELGISPHTVGRHVEKAYRKIGAHRRAEAAAYAVRHGMVSGTGVGRSRPTP